MTHMRNTLVEGGVHPTLARLSDLSREVERVTRENPQIKRRMSIEAFEQLLLESIREGILDPAMRGRPPSGEMIVD